MIKKFPRFQTWTGAILTRNSTLNTPLYNWLVGLKFLLHGFWGEKFPQNQLSWFIINFDHFCSTTEFSLKLGTFSCGKWEKPHLVSTIADFYDCLKIQLKLGASIWVWSWKPHIFIEHSGIFWRNRGKTYLRFSTLKNPLNHHQTSSNVKKN